MVGIVLVSENEEAKEIMKSVRRLLGRTKGISYVKLDSSRSPQMMRRKVGQAVARVRGDKGVLILADIFGSTQCNACLPHVRKGRVELITGFSLAMIIKLAIIHEDHDLKALCQFITKYGREQIKHVESRKCL